MIKVLATNITSPIGYTTEENYQAVRAGRSALSAYDAGRGVPQPFAASLFTEKQLAELSIEGYTHCQSLAIRSMEEAFSQVDIPLQSPRTLLILSTTKADVDELAADPRADGAYVDPGMTARKIADYFGIPTEPIVVCNACISGVTGQLLAHRLVAAGHYDTVVVCGVDYQSAFVIGGFMSFKTLSPEPCRPFDMERMGLNLGDAAATIVLGKDEGGTEEEAWRILSGCLNNDAYHISAPSPHGDGMLKVITETLGAFDRRRLGMVNVHGTGTMFNDQMESVAMDRAGLSEFPISALKGFYGHTLGASGVLETVLCLRAMDDGYIPPVRGYEETGVSGRIAIRNTPMQTDKRTFLKIISGFGGCNGAMLLSKEYSCELGENRMVTPRQTHAVHLTPTGLSIDGQTIATTAQGKALLGEIYHQYGVDYPKFHKMDMFTKLAFLAAELLVRQEGTTEGADKVAGKRGVILFNGSSSVVADRKHIETICNPSAFYPSPSLFVYTLPNIATGEIAIKHHYQGETSLYILNGRNDSLMAQIITSTFAQSSVESMITGWVDCKDEYTFEADLKLLTI